MSISSDWLENYGRQFSTYEEAALFVEAEIDRAMGGQPLNIHSIAVRAKHPDSLNEKVHAKNYADPSNDVTDLIGVRIITLTEATVDDVEKRLRSMFRIDEQRSVDKTAALGDRNVGYRSKHLILQPIKGGVGEVAEILRSTHVEVQVRSILAHAWAELEHSLRYKFGKDIREDLSRRFTLIAGTLELVDLEFSVIEGEIQRDVKDLTEKIRENGNGERSLTTLSLLACLALDRGSAIALGPANLKLPYEDAFRMASLLTRVGLDSVSALRAALEDNDVRQIIREYADRAGGDPDASSAIVVIGSVVAARDVGAFHSVRAFEDERLREAVDVVLADR